MMGKLTVQDGRYEPLYDLYEVSNLVATKGITLAKTTPTTMSELIEKTKEARTALINAVEGMGEGLEKLRPMKKEMTEELRALRMTSATEVAAMLKPLEDLRQFFLGDKHQEEVRRLAEFVELCERLEKLKASGFLDSVADTMLKLAK